jgi:hypothetical protein
MNEKNTKNRTRLIGRMRLKCVLILSERLFYNHQFSNAGCTSSGDPDEIDAWIPQ